MAAHFFLQHSLYTRYTHTTNITKLPKERACTSVKKIECALYLVTKMNNALLDLHFCLVELANITANRDLQVLPF